MLKVNTEKTVSSLEQAIEQIERKLKGMVKGFVSEAVTNASENTPVGSEEALLKNFKYRKFYEWRQEDFGIPMEVGYHAGAWTAGLDNIFPIDPVVNSTSVLGSKAANALGSYQLGQKVYIGASNDTGGFSAFEEGKNGQAPSGVISPTIESLYKIDIRRLYEMSI